MYELNLIKDRQIRYRRRRAVMGYIGIYALVTGLTAVLLASCGLGNRYHVRATEKSLEDIKERVAKASSESGVRSRETTLSELADKLDAVREVTNERMLWSRKLYALSRLAPRELTVTEVAEEIVRPRLLPGAKTAAPPAEKNDDKSGEKVKKPKEEVKRTMVVRGNALAGQADAGELVSNLVELLRQDADFMAGLGGIESIGIYPSPDKEINGLIFEMRWPVVKEQNHG